MSTDTVKRTDGQLLQCFTGRQDEEAFTELVRRHGPMVLGVCRQMLRDEQDAEDAFQATFLVLARKASSIRMPEALPNWLYGVATRIANRARLAIGRRRSREVPLVDPPAADPAAGRAKDELVPFLHEEIGRLPDRYRIPFILCYVDGKTNEEAAEQLGCPPGTVFSRLARARKRLRDRLARRGMVVSSGLFAALLAGLPRDASAAVPPELAAAVAGHARRFAEDAKGTPGTIPVPVLELARQHLRALSRARLTGVAAVLVPGLLLTSILGLSLWLWRGEPPFAERVQGTWRLQAMNFNGTALNGPGLDAVRFRLTLTKDRMSKSGAGVDFSGVYRIDTKADPHRIDWEAVGVPSVHAVIKLEGDTLTICLGHVVDGRALPAPADFTPGQDRSVMVFVRERP